MAKKQVKATKPRAGTYPIFSVPTVPALKFQSFDTPQVEATAGGGQFHTGKYYKEVFRCALTQKLVKIARGTPDGPEAYPCEFCWYRTHTNLIQGRMCDVRVDGKPL